MQKSSFVRVLVGSSVLVGASSASADFVGASFTEEVINPGEVTYKIYLNYDNPLDKQLAVSGNANYSALQLTASSPLIQKHLVIGVPADVPGALALPGDSWVTIGEGLANGGETQFSPGFLAGQEDEFGALISGDGFLHVDNGGYFDSNPSTSVEGTQILIAQFTFAEGTTWTFIGTSDYNANGTNLTNAAFFVSNDCDDNGLIDLDEIAADPKTDCNTNGVLDICESLDDCDGDGVPDVCEADCDSDGLPDGCQSFPDCNVNGIPDVCDIAEGAEDCDQNGIPDECDLADGSRDCNDNGFLDVCDIGEGFSVDCNGNSVPDECDLDQGVSHDCNANGVLDVCDISNGSAADCNGNAVPDECEEDCDENGVPDTCDQDAGASDCDGDGVLDLCQIQDNPDLDCDLDGVLDSCAQGVCDTDITNDCFVDFADLTQLLANWGPCGANCPPGDFDGDGDIGFLDLVELLFEYGECTK